MNKTKESPNGTDRRTAITVGALFIIGTVAGAPSLVFAGSILSDPDYMVNFLEIKTKSSWEHSLC
jgi:hypothetical protein